MHHNTNSHIGPMMGNSANRVLSGNSTKFKNNRIRSVNNNLENTTKSSITYDY